MMDRGRALQHTSTEQTKTFVAATLTFLRDTFLRNLHSKLWGHRNNSAYQRDQMSCTGFETDFPVQINLHFLLCNHNTYW